MEFVVSPTFPMPHPSACPLRLRPTSEAIHYTEVTCRCHDTSAIHLDFGDKARHPLAEQGRLTQRANAVRHSLTSTCILPSAQATNSASVQPNAHIFLHFWEYKEKRRPEEYDLLRTMTLLKRSTNRTPNSANHQLGKSLNHHHICPFS